MHTFNLVEGNAKEKQHQTNLINNTLASEKGLATILPLSIYHLFWEPPSIFMP